VNGSRQRFSVQTAKLQLDTGGMREIGRMTKANGCLIPILLSAHEILAFRLRDFCEGQGGKSPL